MLNLLLFSCRIFIDIFYVLHGYNYRTWRFCSLLFWGVFLLNISNPSIPWEPACMYYQYMYLRLFTELFFDQFWIKDGTCKGYSIALIHMSFCSFINWWLLSEKPETVIICSWCCNEVNLLRYSLIKNPEVWSSCFP